MPGEPQAAHTVLKFQTVQALRAIAALLVVIDHALDMWVGRIKPGGVSPWSNGASGVDIFFVISGFVMVVSSQRLRNESGAWWIFMRHRIVRVVPLYWLMTSVKWLLVFAFADLALRSSLAPDFVLRSYLFLPLVDHAGHFRPLLPVGWTLTYEFLFYSVFAVALAWRVNILAVIVPVFAVFSVLALMRTGEWPVSTILFDTIVVEFVFGVVLAKLILCQWTMPPAVAGILAVVGFVLILTVPQVSGSMRPITWGLPALAIVAGAVSLEKYIAKILPRWLLSLGDASYSIYLTHSLALPVLGVGIAALHWTSTSVLIVMVVACLALASAVGRLCFMVVERPMTLWLKKRVG